MWARYKKNEHARHLRRAKLEFLRNPSFDWMEIYVFMVIWIPIKKSLAFSNENLEFLVEDDEFYC